MRSGCGFDLPEIPSPARSARRNPGGSRPASHGGRLKNRASIAPSVRIGAALKHLCQKRSAGIEHFGGESRRAFDETENAQLIGLAMTGGIGGHVRQAPRRRGRPASRSALPAHPRSRKSSCAKVTPAISGISRRSIATTLPLPSAAPTRLAAIWLQPPGAAPRSTTDMPGFRNAILVVDLDQLVGRARAVALALGLRHIGIVELALQPELGRQLALAAGLDRDMQPAGGVFRHVGSLDSLLFV